ncbi:MAG: triose-phosphate isomerase [Woeseiaceae bacterium]|jgi:triosephosphate isomerase|nr:triose-phosphate isomerase [Woeseiaceae bacterium]|tara:strand:- start:59 stop:811 length:753 start_codon:yes stop_codon:yes gene_type:complete
MRNLMVAGNWKMNGDSTMTSELVDEIAAGYVGSDSCELLICPPFPLLGLAANKIQGTSIFLGAQNLSEYNSGAYTGEVSALMLTDAGCQYVIIGHSERRAIMRETNEMIRKKFYAAIDNNLIPILCVGETLEQKEQQLTMEIIEQQLKSVIGDNAASLTNAVIAYEPVWAIGTGLTATPEEAQSIHHFIRGIISSISQEIADNIQILYGGSVNGGNAKGLFSMPDIDGGLIGGASLTASDFLSIVKATNK